VADRITNRMSGRDFHVFDYACSTASTSTCSTPPVAADYPKIANISAQLYVDPNPGKAPAELRVASGIYLRNQNEKPTADFASTQLGGQAVILNASRSSDPEGRTLAYDWFYGNGTVSLTPAEACATDIKQKENGTSLIYLGQGVTFRYTRPNTYASPMQIQLVVRDPGCLYDTKVQSVTIP
jgi:hypothetical protein